MQSRTINTLGNSVSKGKRILRYLDIAVQQLMDFPDYVIKSTTRALNKVRYVSRIYLLYLSFVILIIVTVLLTN